MDSTVTTLIVTQSVTFVILIAGEIYPFTYGPVRAFLGMCLTMVGRPPPPPGPTTPLIVQT